LGHTLPEEVAAEKAGASIAGPMLQHAEYAERVLAEPEI
jgi:hypothetical protein